MDCRARAILAEMTSAKHSYISNLEWRLATRSTPSWFSDKWQSNEQQVRKEPAGYKEWSGQEVQGSDQLTGGASASTGDGGGEGSGKKRKCSVGTTRKLKHTREDLWELQTKKGSLKKTCMCQTEANDKVWDLNRKTERAFETSALLYTRFEQINGELAR